MRRLTVFLMVSLGLFAFGLALADTVDTVWVRTFGMVGYRNWGRAITVDNAGNVYVAGEYQSAEYITVKYRSNGDTVWVRRFDGGSYATAVKVDAWGNVYVCGIKSNPPHGSRFNYYTLKYDSLGNQLWTVKDSSGGMFDLTYGRASLALDNAGNVYLAGYSSLRTPTWDYLTVKHLPNGDTAWVRTYNGPLNGEDEAQAIAVDDSGNVYVTGYSGGDSVRTQDYCTIKYRSNGDTAWVRRYDGPAHDCDVAVAIAVDLSRNIYITGRSLGIGTSWDYCTIKYRPNGDTAWVRRYSGSTGWSDDEPSGLAVDSFGNITVTGVSDLGYGYDYCTVCYDSVGTEKWVRRYDGPAGGWDRPHALVVDNDGNIYVTGESDGGGFIMDYCTVKYDTLGIERWIARYDSGSVARAIALDTFSPPHIFVTGNAPNYCVTIKYGQSISGIEDLEGRGRKKYSESGLFISNPISTELRVRYYLRSAGHVTLSLYDPLGRRVEVSDKGMHDAGEGMIIMRLNIPSGIYFLRLEGSGQVAIAKVIVVR